jgi:hypothetical protein
MRFASRLLISLILPCFFAVSCGSSRLDTTDAESFNESVKKMYDSATAKDKNDFKNFFYIAMNGRSDLITMSVLKDEDISKLDSFFRVLVTKKTAEELKALHGLSISEIVDLGRNLKITYLDGRIQQIRRELNSLGQSADYYKTYAAQRDRVLIDPATEAKAAEGAPGKIGSITVPVAVENNSDLPLVDIQKQHYGEPWVMEIALGDKKKSVVLNGDSFKNAEGLPLFKNGGIPAHQAKNVTIEGNLADENWDFPPESAIVVTFPEGFEPCLEGWELSFEAEDSFKRVTELERHHALLNRELTNTKA